MREQDGIISRKEDRIVRLEKLLADFKRALFGAKSEKGHLDQSHLALEEIEMAMAIIHAEDEAIEAFREHDSELVSGGKPFADVSAISNE